MNSALGVDSNILCYCLDPSYPEYGDLHHILLDLGEKNRISLNPTVVHEAYHTLVFSQKWVPGEARRRLQMVLAHPCVDFVNQTKRVAEAGLRLAAEHALGGRDALVLATFLLNKVPVLLTRERELLSLGEVRWRLRKILIRDPLEEL